MVLSPGDASWWDGHVRSKPKPDGKALCVNLTTYDEECVDDECVLTSSDYNWIQHDTVVAFTYAKLLDLEKLGKAIVAQLINRPEPPQLPAATLMKVQDSARSSRHLSDDLKKLI